MSITVLSTIGLIIATAAVIYLAYEGFEPLICFPICCILICLTSGISITDGIVGTYCTSFGAMVGKMLFVYLWSTMIGKAMQETGMGRSLAEWLSKIIPAKYAPITICIAGILLSLAGMSTGSVSHRCGFVCQSQLLQGYRSGFPVLRLLDFHPGRTHDAHQ